MLTHGEERALKITGLVSLCMLFFLGLLVHLYPHNVVDERLGAYLYKPQSQFVIHAAMEFTNPTGYFLLLFLIATIIALKSFKNSILVFLFFLVAAAANDDILKHIFSRHKGRALLYPSGHATAACLLAIAIVFAVWSFSKNRWLFWATIVFAFSYTGFVYSVLIRENYHNVTDVVGSSLWALFVAVLCILTCSYEKSVHQEQKHAP